MEILANTVNKILYLNVENLSVTWRDALMLVEKETSELHISFCLFYVPRF